MLFYRKKAGATLLGCSALGAVGLLLFCSLRPGESPAPAAADSLIPSPRWPRPAGVSDSAPPSFLLRVLHFRDSSGKRVDLYGRPVGC